jgi:uncharacterized oxidoreductase
LIPAAKSNIKMKISGNTILITGGATGIGLALAEAFLNAGNTVVICGRRPEKLEMAKEKFPALDFTQCDVSDDLEREVLISWMIENYPGFNILINNAGIQKMHNFLNDIDSSDISVEIAINFEAPVHLASLCIPHFLQQNQASIINITSGLAFIPLAVVPVYCATKAALHSFTISLRQQLKESLIKVFEIAPPIVNTDLDKGAREHRGQQDRGIEPEEVAAESLKAVEQDQFEVMIGMAKNLYAAARSENAEIVFRRMNG